MLGELDKRIRSLRAGGGSQQGFNQDIIDNLLDDLKKLREEFEAHRDLTNNTLGQLTNEMPNKADKKDLIDLENRIMD